MKIRTQKARGLSVLKKSKVWGIHTPNYILVQDKKDLNDPLIGLPIFARPCPTVPRHGFVDSKKITSQAGLKKLLKEAQAVDPKAEIILMDKVECEASAILTPTQVTIGPSNDGATQGKNCVVLPLAHLKRNQTDEKKAGITQAPYFEVLFDKHYSYSSYCSDNGIKSVQLRDGPATRVAGNFIPEDTVITKVINVKNHTDLLKWETLMQNCAKGTVVYHPKGSAVSHYSVHAVINNIPVIFDHRPKLGDQLVKNTDKQERFYDDLLRGINQGLNTDIDYDASHDALNIGLFGTHHATALIGSKEGAHLIGVGASALLRLGMAACLGEAAYDGDISDKHELLTEDYDTTLSEFVKSRKLMPIVFHSFYIGGLANGQECGFGGDAWGGCAGSTIRLDRKIHEFGKNPCDKTFADLIGEMHVIVNIAHNNGNFLNKFDSGYSEDAFDDAADAEPKTILRCALSYYRWVKANKKIRGGRTALSLKPYSMTAKNFKSYPTQAFMYKEEDCWDDDDVKYEVVVSTKYWTDSSKKVTEQFAKQVIKSKPKSMMLKDGESDYDDGDWYEKKKGYILTPALIKKLPAATRKWIKKKLAAAKKKPIGIAHYLKKEKL